MAKSLGATVALGGLTAFPFYATLSALCTALSGEKAKYKAASQQHQQSQRKQRNQKSDIGTADA